MVSKLRDGNQTLARHRRDFLRRFAAFSVGAMAGLPTGAQTFPNRRMTMILPAAPGTPSDLVGRQLGHSIAAQANFPVVPDNRPGANGVIGVQAVLNAPADGHTLLFTTLSTMAVNKAMIKDLPYEPLKDFVTLGVMYRTWLFLTINPKLPFKTAQELIAHARTNPGKLNFGYGTAIPQLAGKMLEQLSGAQFTFVPYKAHTAMMQGLVAGELDVSITDPLSFGEFVKSGQLRVLAATSPSRVPGFTDTPTLAESGVPGYELSSAHVCMVRSGTPPQAIARLTELLTTASKSPELHTFLKASSIDDFFVNGAEATRYLTNEIERIGKIARGAGLLPA